MAAFDSGAFASAFDAEGIPSLARVTRAVLELLAEHSEPAGQEVTARRLGLEALSLHVEDPALGAAARRLALEVLAEAADEPSADRARTSRSALEVLAALPAEERARTARIGLELLSEVPAPAPERVRSYRAGLEVLSLVPAPSSSLAVTYRQAVEVIRPDTFTLPQPRPRVRRSVVEVMAWAKPPGAAPRVLRTGAELLGTAAALVPGLDLPLIAVSNVAVFLALTPSPGASGSVGLLSPHGEGLTVSWGPSGPLTVAWRYQGTVTSTTQARASGANVVRFTAPAPGMRLAELGLTRPEGFEGGSTIHELLVFDRLMGSEDLDRYQAYLTKRWVAGEAASPCDPYVPPEPPESCDVHLVWRYADAGQGVNGLTWVGKFTETYAAAIEADPDTYCPALPGALEGLIAVTGGLPVAEDNQALPDLLDPSVWLVTLPEGGTSGGGLINVSSSSPDGTVSHGSFTIFRDGDVNTIDASGIHTPLPTAPFGETGTWALQGTLGGLVNAEAISLRLDAAPLAVFASGRAAEWLNCIGGCPLP